MAINKEVMFAVPSVIIKRDGSEAPFEPGKIEAAIWKAVQACGGTDRKECRRLASLVTQELCFQYAQTGEYPTVEGTQDWVEKILIHQGHATVAKAYILYREKRNQIRLGKTSLMKSIGEIIKESKRDNANVGQNASAKMLQVAGAASKERFLMDMPQEFAQAHRIGDIHIHDLDFFGSTINCLQIPLAKLLQKGFNNGHGYIRPPKRPASAGALAAIILQSSQNDLFGGQSFAFFDRDMAPYMKDADERECYQVMEALVYNLNSMHSRAGSQVVFSSLNIGTDTSEAGRKVTRNLLKAFKAGMGAGETPVFPNLVFRLKEGVNFNPGDPNYDLFRLALETAAYRMNPTFSFMDSSFNKPYGDQVAYMGCRTRVMANCNGPEVTEGRGNLGFVTVNLPRLGINAEGGDIEGFFKALDNIMDLAIRQLYYRYQVCCELKGKDLPFVIGQKLYLGSEDVGPEDSIEPCLKHATLSVGFIGLAECLTALVGENHAESEAAWELGYKIIEHMRKKPDEAIDRYRLNYTLMATPAEGLSSRFTRLDQKLYGVIAGVTDKEFYTNSFHVPVWQDIGMARKLEIEGPFHKLTNGAHISYVELDAPPVHNIEAIEALLRHAAKQDIGYTGINFPIDECIGIPDKPGCGNRGVISEDVCPNCGGKIQRIRRITGYLAELDRWGEGKLAEHKLRKPHFFSNDFSVTMQ